MSEGLVVSVLAGMDQVGHAECGWTTHSLDTVDEDAFSFSSRIFNEVDGVIENTLNVFANWVF